MFILAFVVVREKMIMQVMTMMTTTTRITMMTLTKAMIIMCMYDCLGVCIHACVCACECACAHACVRMCMFVIYVWIYSRAHNINCYSLMFYSFYLIVPLKCLVRAFFPLQIEVQWLKLYTLFLYDLFIADLSFWRRLKYTHIERVL